MSYGNVILRGKDSDVSSVSSTITLTWPSGIQNNDKALLFVDSITDDGVSTISDPVTPGFSDVFGGVASIVPPTIYDSTVKGFIKTCNGTESGSLIITIDNDVVSYGWSATLFVFGNVDTYSSTSSLIQSPAISTNVGSAVIRLARLGGDSHWGTVSSPGITWDVTYGSDAEYYITWGDGSNPEDRQIAITSETASTPTDGAQTWPHVDSGDFGVGYSTIVLNTPFGSPSASPSVSPSISPSISPSPSTSPSVGPNFAIDWSDEITVIEPAQRLQFNVISYKDNVGSHEAEVTIKTNTSSNPEFLLNVTSEVIQPSVPPDISLLPLSFVGSDYKVERNISTDPMVNKPSGVIDGDFLIVSIMGIGATTYYAPSGWSTAYSNFGDFNNSFGVTFYKYASSEPSQYTFVRPSSNGSVFMSILAFRNVFPSSIETYNLPLSNDSTFPFMNISNNPTLIYRMQKRHSTSMISSFGGDVPIINVLDVGDPHDAKTRSYGVSYRLVNDNLIDNSAAWSAPSVINELAHGIAFDIGAI